MTTPQRPASVDALKAEARALRGQTEAAGGALSHAQALEQVAKKHGYRDWNTASARAPMTTDCPVALGDAVSGRYFNQPFIGRVLRVGSFGPNLYTLTIQFDAPVNVTPDLKLLTIMRSRINARINTDGVSPDRTSDGNPHLALDLNRRR